jgi:hypothetical protein
MSWIIGIQKPITWVALDWFYIDGNNQPQPDSVKIEISRDNGGTWATIIADTPNTGAYLWTITGPTAAQALVRLTGVHNTDVSFTSPLFSIVNQALTSVIVVPLAANVPPSGTLQFVTYGYDQDGNLMIITPTWTWATSGGGTMGLTGLFTAGSTIGGPFDVTATSGGVVGHSALSVSNLMMGNSKCWTGIGLGL